MFFKNDSFDRTIVQKCHYWLMLSDKFFFLFAYLWVNLFQISNSSEDVKLWQYLGFLISFWAADAKSNTGIIWLQAPQHYFFMLVISSSEVKSMRRWEESDFADVEEIIFRFLFLSFLSSGWSLEEITTSSWCWCWCWSSKIKFDW